MSQGREGLYATIYLSDDVAAITTANTVALLTGVELSWAQNKRRFFQLGSIIPSSVLDGVITYDGAFRRAFFTTKYIGSVNIGTCNFIGSICPRGTAQPAMMGSLKITSGNIRNMATESAEAVAEEQTFIFYNVSFFG
jgi:hypothetical protein